jgi:hypothetical protein
MMGLCQMIMAVGFILIPKLSLLSLSEYGARITSLLILVCVAQSFVASALLQPVEDHMKVVEYTNVNTTGKIFKLLKVFFFLIFNL